MVPGVGDEGLSPTQGRSMIIRQHIPNSCSGVEPKKCLVNSLTEMEAVPWIEIWKASWQTTTRSVPFTGFMWPELPPGQLLMAVYGNNEKWWVVGYVRDGSLADFGLLEWKPPHA